MSNSPSSASTSTKSLKYASDASTSMQLTVLPPRDTLKSIILVFTVTFATIINVSPSRAPVCAMKRTFFEPIFIDWEFIINFDNYTNNSKGVGLANCTTPVDCILLSFKYRKSRLFGGVKLRRWIYHNYPNTLGLSPARLRESGRCIREEKDVYIWSCGLGGIYPCLCILKKWAKIMRDFRLEKILYPQMS